ncbi:MAG: hypothetical protein V5A39_03645 [Haloarculaceae archaeon]
MSTSKGMLARFRQPEYTGENRCLPCTVVNTAIAAVLAAAVGVAVVPMTSVAVGATAGASVFALCAAAIYLRGYLVPGTPELTKRYFPPWLLDRFGKGSAAASQERPASVEEIDPETELMAADALEECPDRPDLCLTDGFRTDWYAAIDRVRETEAGREELLGLLDVTEGEVEYEEYGAAFRARVDDTLVGTWESRAAFLADLGAANALAGYHPDWDALGLRGQSQLLNGLRLFVDTCPACGGSPEFGTDTVESCCTSHEVAAVSCPDCGARLFESDPL